MFKTIAACIAATILVPGFLAADMTCNAIGCSGTPDRIWINAVNGDVIIVPEEFPSTITDVVDCTPVMIPEETIRLARSSPAFAEAYALLLVADAKGVPIDISISGFGTECEVTAIQTDEDNPARSDSSRERSGDAPRKGQG